MIDTKKKTKFKAFIDHGIKQDFSMLVLNVRRKNLRKERMTKRRTLCRTK